MLSFYVCQMHRLLFKAATTRGNWVTLTEGQLIHTILVLSPGVELYLNITLIGDNSDV